MSDLRELDAKRDEYDSDSQVIIDALKFTEKEIASVDAMRRTDGWKLLEKRIREDLQSRIRILIEKDPEVVTLVALLNVADTKSRQRALDEEVEKILSYG